MLHVSWKRWSFVLELTVGYFTCSSQWSRAYISHWRCQQRNYADLKCNYSWWRWWGNFFPGTMISFVLILPTFLLWCSTFLCQILVPVPQYPLYSATMSLLGGSLVPYYLEETANWGLDINNLRESVAQARYKGITVSLPLCFTIAYIIKSVGLYCRNWSVFTMIFSLGKSNGDYKPWKPNWTMSQWI